MNESVILVLRRATILWIGSGLVFALNIWAGTSGDRTLFAVSLALTGIFALFGIGFGIWAARTVAKPTSVGSSRHRR